MTLSRSIHISTNDPISFLFYSWYMYHIFFIHSSVDKHLGCFHVLAIVHSAVMNTEVYVFFFFFVRPHFHGLYWYWKAKSSKLLPFCSTGGFCPPWACLRHVSFWIIVFSWYMPSKGIVGSYGRATFLSNQCKFRTRPLASSFLTMAWSFTKMAAGNLPLIVDSSNWKSTSEPLPMRLFSKN